MNMDEAPNQKSKSGLLNIATAIGDAAGGWQACTDANWEDARVRLNRAIAQLRSADAKIGGHMCSSASKVVPEEKFENLVGTMRRHAIMMSPEKKARLTGRLFMAAIEEIERLRSEDGRDGLDGPHGLDGPYVGQSIESPIGMKLTVIGQCEDRLWVRCDCDGETVKRLEMNVNEWPARK